MITSASADFNTAVQAKVRNQLKKKITIGGTVYTGKVKTCKISDVFNASDSNISVGVACSNSVKLNLEYVSGFSYETDSIVIEEGYDLAGNNNPEYVPMGTFYPSPPAKSTDDFNTVNITAYDALGKMSGNYVSELSLPTTDTAIVNEICSKYGINFVGKTLGCTINEIYEASEAETLGYMAGLQGMNAHMTRNNELTFKWFYNERPITNIAALPIVDISAMTLNDLFRIPNGASPQLEISRGIQFQDGLVRNSENDFKIQSVTSGTDDQQYTAGTGKGIAFENPYITQEQVTTIYERLVNLEFLDCKVTWRGNPAVESGDAVIVYDKAGTAHQAFIGQRDMECSTDYKETFKSITEGNATIHFDTRSPADRKLKKVMTNLQNAITEATELLNGAKGGIMRTIDTDGDGIPDKVIFASSKEINLPADAHVVIATYEGVGVSTNGGQTYVNAITGEGINADAITTGKISSVSFENTGIKYFYASDYTAEDATRCQNISLHSIVPTKADFEKYDLNGDGIINVQDVKLVNNLRNGNYGTYIAIEFKFSSAKDSVGLVTETHRYSQNGAYPERTSIPTFLGTNGAVFKTVYGDGTISISTIGGGGLHTHQISADDGYFSGTVTQASRESLKKNIESESSMLNLVRQAEIYSYNYKSEEDTARKHHGFVIGDEGGNYSTPEELIVEGGIGIDTYSMLGVLFKAVQELADIVLPESNDTQIEGGQNNG